MSGWTLGQIRESVFDLEAHCENEDCRHFYAIDLEPLIREWGADLGLDDVPPLACPDCGNPLKLWLAAPAPGEAESAEPDS